ncbi:restriction endonuclease subunit S [Agrobacterium tumefaciens]|uniref:restriction endonuclease subunit S n=1 Tax=Agrobacterium tumefaciens TaxID=358 RepID=UPI0021CFF944|nr:restriction endonuclease subunit S [Agrobacterium tumefaciens]UXT20029.1 restriction endonuclease subunit S [Agrobacterium tumefaciens]
MSREVPEGWTSVRLSALVEIERVSFSINEINSFDSVRLYSLPAFDSGAVPEKTAGSEVLSNKYRVPADCILFSKLNPRIPRVWRVKHEHREPALGSTEFWPLTPRKGNVDLDFLTSFLTSADFLNSPEITPASSTNSHQRVDRKAFENFEMLLPPLHEQRRIAEILSSVDEALVVTREVVEQTRKVKQGVLERLLTKGIGHTRFKQTEIGEIPEGWEVVELQDVASVRTGLAKNKKEIPDAVELPYLRVANVQDGYVDLSDLQTISVSRSRVERYSLMKGDVLMTEGGDYDKLGRGDVWDGAVKPCLHQNHVFAVRADQERLIPEFLANLTASRSGKAYFQSCSKRSTNLASINSTQVKQFPVRLPDLSEQSEIVRVSKSFDAAISVATSNLSQQLRLKAALMSDLLTGRRRVIDGLPMAAE